MRVTAQKNSLWMALAVAGLIGGAGVSLFQINGLRFTPEPVSPVAPKVVQVSPAVVAPIERRVSIYWIEPTDRTLKGVPKIVEAPSTEEAVEAALKTLFSAPPTEGGFYSAIPSNAKLLNFSANEQDIFVNVSQEFVEGGGSASMIGRTVQVLYTATSLNPDANFFLLVNGKPIGNLGGEGLEIKQPMTRQDLPLEF